MFDVLLPVVSYISNALLLLPMNPEVLRIVADVPAVPELPELPSMPIMPRIEPHAVTENAQANTNIILVLVIVFSLC